jgi:hypothetical protein
MFQLLDLIISSPIGAFVLACVQDTIYAALIISDCDDCGFNDLGKLLFGGLVLAILVGIVVSVFLRRMKERGIGSLEFISIRSTGRKE